MRTGWLIYNEADASRNRSYIDWFLAEAQELAMGLELVYKEELGIGVTESRLSLYRRGQRVNVPDYIVMRHRDERLTAHLEAMGAPVFNGSFVSRTANDKARTSLYLAQHGIPMPDTRFLSKEDFREANVAGLPFPQVLKTVGGHGGSEVYRVQTPSEVTERLAASPPGSSFVLQEMVTPGKDVRVFVIGRTIVGAVLRESSSDFRANHSLGGDSSLHLLSAEEEALALRIVELFDFGLAGIDFIYGRDGKVLLNEIEDVVGSRTLSLHSDINLVRLYLNHIQTVLDSTIQGKKETNHASSKGTQQDV
ncbi:ATP-grasp domain-containing protein [Gorillibacterium sp. CAU 1737]|uniref:ATP-grasp domain-containing protein n=1 Tax=Gorillibacterium sp. CAU 1737 TaxID=3140362 RepID=UPI0032602429